MNPLPAFVRALKRERGLALADELLAASRPLAPLSEGAHARIKRRLVMGMAHAPASPSPWLKPTVATVVLLVGGVASGVVFDRLVLKKPAAGKAATETSIHRTAPGKAGRTRPPLAPDPHEPRDDGEASASTVADPGLAAGLCSMALVSPAWTPAPPAEAVQAKAGAKAPADGRPRPIASRKPSLPATAPLLPGASSTGVASVAPPFPSTEPPAYSRAAAWAERRAWSGREAPVDSQTCAEDEVLAPQLAALQPAAWASSPSQLALRLPVPTPRAWAPAPRVRMTPPEPVPSEEEMLARTVRALRAGKDARSALDTLDTYREQYPDGRLWVEARILRVDALTAANRADEALLVLDGLDLDRLPGSLGRYLQRAELRAHARRWQAAHGDLDWVLAHATEDDTALIERALWARMGLWREQGNQERLHEDAADYLRRFPRGRFAGQVRLLLRQGGP